MRLKPGFSFIFTAIAMTFSFATARGADRTDLSEKIAPYLEAAKPTETSHDIDGVKYRIWDAKSIPALQKIIDESFELIYSTRAAQNTLLISAVHEETLWMRVASNLEDWDTKAYKLEHDLGVPFTLTSQILDRSSSEKQTRPIAYATAIGDYQVRAKRYFFALSTDGSLHKYDSFTAPNNHTIIFIDPTQSDRLSILKLLAHEVAISGDQKSNLENTAAVSKLDYMSEEKALAEVPAELKLTAVNAVFKVVRALMFERNVLNELFPRQTSDFSTNEGEEEIYSSNLNSESSCRSLVLSQAQLLTKLDYVPAGTEDAIRQLFLNHSKMQVFKSRVETCTFAATPFVRWHGYKTEGPRPRIGDWNRKNNAKRVSGFKKSLTLGSQVDFNKFNNPLLRNKLNSKIKPEREIMEKILKQQYLDISGRPVRFTK